MKIIRVGINEESGHDEDSGEEIENQEKYDSANRQMNIPIPTKSSPFYIHFPQQWSDSKYSSTLRNNNEYNKKLI